jgi:hypothetical protein
MGQGRLGPSRFRCLSSRTIALHARFVRPCLRLAQGLSVQCRLAQAPLNTPSESILCAKLSGHGGSAVSAAVVLDDSRESTVAIFNPLATLLSRLQYLTLLMFRHLCLQQLTSMSLPRV